MLEQSDLIHLREARRHHNLVTTAFSGVCCRLTATKKKHSGSGQDAFVSVTVSVRPLKCNQGQDICFQDTQASVFDLKSAVTANDFRSLHTVKDKS